MVRTYTRKTERGKVDLSIYKEAANAIANGGKVRVVARELNLKMSSLQRYLKKLKKIDAPEMGYQGTKIAHQILTIEMEKELAIHVKALSEHFYGLSKVKHCAKWGRL